MPLVQIDTTTVWQDDDLTRIGDAVQAAMVAALDVPERDRFQLIQTHAPGRLRFDPGFVGQTRSERFVLVRITLSHGRTTDAKRTFYRLLITGLQEAVDLPAGDLAVVLTENGREDWSFGGGIATYVELPREEWR